MSDKISWDDYCKLLIEYREKHGNLLVPTNYVTEKGIKLGHLVKESRGFYNRHDPNCRQLTSKQIEELEAIGMVWNISEYKWEEMYRQAKIYKEEYGNLVVPAKYITKNGMRLGLWLLAQRSAYNGLSKTKIKQQRIEKLEAIGMVWDISEYKWEEMYRQAKIYKAEYGNLLVPYSYETKDGVRLGAWINSTCQKYKSGRLQQEKIDKLDEIGMIWETKDKKWKEMYQKAAKYYEEHKHLQVGEDKEYKSLRAWLYQQRSRRKNGIATEEQIELLDAIEMNWEISDIIWRRQLTILKQYVNKYSDLKKIPKTHRKIHAWVKKQQRNYRSAKLSRERIELLKEIGVKLEFNEVTDEQPKKQEEESSSSLVKKPTEDIKIEDLIQIEKANREGRQKEIVQAFGEHASKYIEISNAINEIINKGRINYLVADMRDRGFSVKDIEKVYPIIRKVDEDLLVEDWKGKSKEGKKPNRAVLISQAYLMSGQRKSKEELDTFMNEANGFFITPIFTTGIMENIYRRAKMQTSILDDDEIASVAPETENFRNQMKVKRPPKKESFIETLYALTSSLEDSEDVQELVSIEDMIRRGETEKAIRMFGRKSRWFLERSRVINKIIKEGSLEQIIEIMSENGYGKADIIKVFPIIVKANQLSQRDAQGNDEEEGTRETTAKEGTRETTAKEGTRETTDEERIYSMSNEGVKPDEMMDMLDSFRLETPLTEQEGKILGVLKENEEKKSVKPNPTLKRNYKAGLSQKTDRGSVNFSKVPSAVAPQVWELKINDGLEKEAEEFRRKAVLKNQRGELSSKKTGRPRKEDREEYVK